VFTPEPPRSTRPPPRRRRLPKVTLGYGTSSEQRIVAVKAVGERTDSQIEAALLAYLRED